MLNAKLVVVGGDPRQTEIELQLPTIIGRGRDVGLTVPQALVSRRHSEIFEKNGKLFVRDLGSLNGTFVNNKRIESDQPLEPGQLLTLGTVTFRAVYQIGDDSIESQMASNEQTHSAFSSDTIKEIGGSESEENSLPLETVDIDSIRPPAFTPPEPHSLTPASEPPRDDGNEKRKSAQARFDMAIDESSNSEAKNRSKTSSFMNNLPR